MAVGVSQPPWKRTCALCLCVDTQLAPRTTAAMVPLMALVLVLLRLMGLTTATGEALRMLAVR